MSTATILRDGLNRLALALPDDVQARLLDYLALVQKWNKIYNLTAVRDADKMLTHHLLDSLAVAPHVKGHTLLDVGSGAGLPGIPLALALPQVQVTLLDSNHKKATFLSQVAIELKLSNVKVVCERVENYRPTQRFDLVISRAFSELANFVSLAGGLVAEGGTLLAMKGTEPLAEIERIAHVNVGFRLAGVTSLDVPGLDAARHLVFLKAA